jgi:hypothetical protein
VLAADGELLRGGRVFGKKGEEEVCLVVVVRLDALFLGLN